MPAEFMSYCWICQLMKTAVFMSYCWICQLMKLAVYNQTCTCNKKCRPRHTCTAKKFKSDLQLLIRSFVHPLIDLESLINGELVNYWKWLLAFLVLIQI